MKQSEASVGSRVRWTYKHHLNSKSYTYITKDGTLLGFTRDKFKNLMAIIQFDGNKTKSKVRADQIIRL